MPNAPDWPSNCIALRLQRTPAEAPADLPLLVLLGTSAKRVRGGDGEKSSGARAVCELEVALPAGKATVTNHDYRLSRQCACNDIFPVILRRCRRRQNAWRSSSEHRHRRHSQPRGRRVRPIPGGTGTSATGQTVLRRPRRAALKNIRQRTGGGLPADPTTTRMGDPLG